MRHALARAHFVALLRIVKQRKLRVTPVDQVGVRQQSAKLLIAMLQIRIFDSDLGERFRVRIEHVHALAPQTRHGLRLRLIHGVQHGVQQIQRHHHQHARQRIAALQLPGDAAGVPREFVRPLLRVDAVSLHVFFIANVADRIRVRIGILQVRPLARVRVGENHICANLQRAADGFHKRIGRLDRHIDGALGVIARGLVRIKDDGHLRQPRHRAHIMLLQRDRQFQRDHLRPVPQDRLAHLNGELQPPRRHWKVGEAPAPQAARIGQIRKADFPGHSAAPLLRAFAGWPFPAPGSRVFARWPGSSA